MSEARAPYYLKAPGIDDLRRYRRLLDADIAEQTQADATELADLARRLNLAAQAHDWANVRDTVSRITQRANLVHKRLQSYPHTQER